LWLLPGAAIVSISVSFSHPRPVNGFSRGAEIVTTYDPSVLIALD
jgi:hypothetical protein